MDSLEAYNAMNAGTINYNESRCDNCGHGYSRSELHGIEDRDAKRCDDCQDCQDEADAWADAVEAREHGEVERALTMPRGVTITITTNGAVYARARVLPRADGQQRFIVETEQTNELLPIEELLNDAMDFMGVKS